MKKTIHKWFWLWNFEKEERWLNEMAGNGMILAGVGFARYDFDKCAPGEYIVRLEMLKEPVSRQASEDYIRFLEDTGVEHVGTLFRWAYFRKKAGGAPFDLFSDIDSRINHLNRMLTVPCVICISNLINSINMTHRQILNGTETDFQIPVAIAWAATALIAYCIIRIFVIKQKLKKERMLRE
jgi:hypothetical protein